MSKLFSLPARAITASLGFAGTVRIRNSAQSRQISTQSVKIPDYFSQKYYEAAQSSSRRIYLPIAESYELKNAADELKSDLESQKRKGCQDSAQILEAAKNFATGNCQAVFFSNSIPPIKNIAAIDIDRSISIASEKANGADNEDYRLVAEQAPNLMFFAHFLRICGQEAYYNRFGDLFAKPYFLITGQEKQSAHVDGFELSNSVDSILLHALSSQGQCATAVIDGDDLLNLLSPESKAELQRPIFYSNSFNFHRADESSLPSLVPIIFEDKQGKLRINFDPSAIAISPSISVSAALSELSDLTFFVMSQKKQSFNLRTNESLLLNNYQVLHARDAAQKTPSSTEVNEPQAKRTLLRTFFTNIGDS